MMLVFVLALASCEAGRPVEIGRGTVDGQSYRRLFVPEGRAVSPQDSEDEDHTESVADREMGAKLEADGENLEYGCPLQYFPNVNRYKHAREDFNLSRIR